MSINGDPTNEPNPQDFMIRVRHVDGEVVFEFSHQVKHFRLHPEIMIQITESAIAASVAAAEYLQKKRGVIVQVQKKDLIIPAGLPGLPKGK